MKMEIMPSILKLQTWLQYYKGNHDIIKKGSHGIIIKITIRTSLLKWQARHKYFNGKHGNTADQSFVGTFRAFFKWVIFIHMLNFHMKQGI